MNEKTIPKIASSSSSLENEELNKLIEKLPNHQQPSSPRGSKPSEVFKRMVCPSCGYTFYNNPIPVVAAIVEWRDHEHVVLIQNKTWPENWYGLVSGFIEAKEAPLDACKREIKEELGLSNIEVSEKDLIGVYNFPLRNELIIVYHVQVLSNGTDKDEQICIDKDELSDYQMVKIDKLRPWKAATGYGLRDWLIKIGVTHNADNFVDPFKKGESVVDKATASKL
ncbi:predicted protein [Naegleria gruberi]|uniref:Predicted protein n=1 Tax=Naegleria gruberi TaxID=5762 RepID=D2VHU3_NAEGR|nr:uncharacterized protein NAEGRDRAFT_49655 [Naegleria gruberi]EFC43652.1 predicted protein [Naegleria gruberi]|eukprot:XP_002676396.1 predicted protein [Naegleria gruberi strain NEG-M]